MPRVQRLAVLCLAVGLIGGCQSAEEECNEARVAAHDAWSQYIVVAAREVEEAQAREAEHDPLAIQAAAERSARAEFREHVQALNIDLATDDADDPLAGLDVPDALPSDDVLRARGVPEHLFQQRDRALAAARQAHRDALEAQVRESGRAAVAEDRLQRARQALDAARGPAIAARDAYRDVPTGDEVPPELEAAIAASNTSWDACQSVDP